VNRFADKFVLKCGALIGLLLPMTAILCQAGDSKTIDDGTLPPENALAEYFSNWFSRASAIQADQPHWADIESLRLYSGIHGRSFGLHRRSPRDFRSPFIIGK
jgi:hypothetical protein